MVRMMGGLTLAEELLAADNATAELFEQTVDEQIAEAKAPPPWEPHAGQAPPPGDWRIWLMLAGRGFGKTRAGAEWITALARVRPDLRVALVGASIDEAAEVMVRGRSGLMAVADRKEDVVYYPSRRLVEFGQGARAYLYSGEKPDKLRGPEHHVAWVDELAKFAWPDETWDNLLLGLRLGDLPRVLVTTTPRPIGLVKTLKADVNVVKTGGATADNRHLPASFVADVTERYGATRLGRQELLGEIVEDVEGALWTRDLVERCRVLRDASSASSAAPHDERFSRIFVAVDPPVSAGGDACGILVCGLGVDGGAYVLADHSVSGLSPEGWARCVAAAAEAHGADRVIAEGNQGGEMVASVLKAADCALPVRIVHATRGKAARAEPVAALFESGKAWFAGAFPELEDELCGLQIGGGYAGPGRSPDRADAMVWALTELMLRGKGAPSVRGL